MRFSLAWAVTAAQNVTLRAIVMALAIVSVSLAILVARLSLRPPLVIERACLTSTIETAGVAPTAKEVETFAREAVRQRFNTDAIVITGYLDSEEESNRQAEQKDLTGRNMSQSVVVRSVKIDGDKAVVDADRLIAIGSVRSALAFPLSVKVATVRRTLDNPYGLRATSFEQPKAEGGGR